MSKRLVRRGELARVLGIPWPTVRFYTQLGLLPVAGHTPHGQFLYDPEQALETFGRINQMKGQRYSIAEIRTVLAGNGGGNGHGDGVRGVRVSEGPAV